MTDGAGDDDAVASDGTDDAAGDERERGDDDAAGDERESGDDDAAGDERGSGDDDADRDTGTDGAAPAEPGAAPAEPGAAPAEPGTLPAEPGAAPAEPGAVTRVDLHVKVVDEDVVERAKAAGLDVLVYAPHFEHLSTIRERADRFSDDDLLVVPAREYFTGRWSTRKHVLAVDPDYPVPDFLTLEDTMAELDDQHAAVLAPHPEFLTLSLDREDIATYADRIDAVEVYNPKHWPWDNRRAREIARDSGLRTYLSSYAHLGSTIGEAWVELEAEVDSTADLVAALRGGAPRRMFHRNGLDHALQCRVEFAHLGWENSWEKFKRVVLTDMESTHPARDGYDERFAEMNAYR